MTVKNKYFHIISSALAIFQIVYYYFQAYRFGLGAGFFAFFSLIYLLIYFCLPLYYYLFLKGKRLIFKWEYLSLILVIIFALQLAFWLGRWTLKM